MWKKCALLVFVVLVHSAGMRAVSAADDASSCLYFAHPMNTYDTALEKKLLARIYQTFPNMRILNPAELQYREGWGRNQRQYGNPMLYYTIELMPSCSGGVVALPYRDGKWSPGVYLEMMEAYVIGRPVWTIRADGQIREMKQFPSGLLSIKENRAYARRNY